MIINSLKLCALIGGIFAANCGPAHAQSGAPRGPNPVPGLDHPRDVFGPATKRQEGATDAKPDAIGDNKDWSIVLVVFRGDERDQYARLALNKVRVEGGLPDAYMEKRGESTVVAYGSFASGDAPDAAAELKRIQGLVIAGERPYQYALLAPPANKSMEGDAPQLNLLRAKEMFGDDALYTLQVGVYAREEIDRPTEKDLAEARKAAEEAARRLRQQGELAFYYHGPRRSMVTIGVFDINDYDPQLPSYQSARLLETKKRHPLNLYNGQGILQKKKGDQKGTLQQSTLVAIPKA